MRSREKYWRTLRIFLRWPNWRASITNRQFWEYIKIFTGTVQTQLVKLYRANTVYILYNYDILSFRYRSLARLEEDRRVLLLNHLGFMQCPSRKVSSKYFLSLLLIQWYITYSIYKYFCTCFHNNAAKNLISIQVSLETFKP